MFEVGEKVMVIEENRIMGFASVVDQCRKEKDLQKYFFEGHPLQKRYMTAVLNEKTVFIVEFDRHLGQGGFLEEHLRRTN